MPILLKMNLRCNFNCAYCYQREIRPEEEVIDYPAVEKTILELWEKGGGKDPKTGKIRLDEKDNYVGPTITLHGGEPTIMSERDIERYLKLSHQLTRKSGIQTNGYNITDNMVRIFKKYNTHVGFSLDGPWPLNELRGFGTPEERQVQTERSFANLKRLRQEKISCSIIAVIHKRNAMPERRQIFKDWITELTANQVTGRLNPCCTGIEDIDLTVPEAIEFYTDMYDFMIEKGYPQWSPFKDIINSFRGEKEVVCAFRTCDPLCTNSATSVLNDGSVGVCLRLYGDGYKYLRGGTSTSMRPELLRQTDCKDCEWFGVHCYGGCSGLSVDFDWRNKDRYCELYKALFTKTRKLLDFIKLKDQGKEKSQQKPQGQLVQGSGEPHYDDITHTDGDTIYMDSDKKGFPQ